MGTLAGPLTRWNDYVGVAAADDALVLRGDASLYDLSGLDRDRWTIVAVDVVLAPPGNAATVYAVDREATEMPDRGPAADAGPVLVHPFTISAHAVDVFLQHAFDRVAVRLVTQQYHGTPLVLAEAAELLDAPAGPAAAQG